MPRDLGDARNRFQFELNKSKWFDDFKIKRNYGAELKSTPGPVDSKAQLVVGIVFSDSLE